ncbi:hypothetical protein ACFQX7_12020 [Luedemannella flava]
MTVPAPPSANWLTARPSAAPSRISAGTPSTQPSCATRNAVRPRVSRRDHSHRKNSGTTLCRWVNITKWYDGKASDAASAPPSPANAAARHQACRTA